MMFYLGVTASRQAFVTATLLLFGKGKRAFLCTHFATAFVNRA